MWPSFDVSLAASCKQDQEVTIRKTAPHCIFISTYLFNNYVFGCHLPLQGMKIKLQTLSVCSQQKGQPTAGDNCPEETADKYEPTRDASRSNSANPSSSAFQHRFYFILNQILTIRDRSLHDHFIYTSEMQDTLCGQQLKLLSRAPLLQAFPSVAS